MARIAPTGALRQRRPPRRSKAHLAFLRELPCCHCPQARAGTAHHLQGADAGKALGQRTDDYLAVPLCWQDHQHGPEALHRQGEQTFWNGRDPIALAGALEEASGDIERGTAIVTAWREQHA